MAKLTDKFFNRIIEGPLELQSEDKKQVEDLADARIEELVEGGTLENAKPIYWHGIDLFSNDNSFQFHILNNDNTPIDTIAKVKAWAESIEGQVNMTGNGTIVIEGVAHTMTVLVKQSNNHYSIVYVGASGYGILNDINIEDYFTTCVDYSNKIN